MGILNVTPDSFFDGNRYNSIDQAIQQAEKMLNEGADIIDVGGYSSRPGAEDISVTEETDRVVPVIAAIVKAFPGTIISIDTFRADVAKHALDNGASIINDITGGDHDPLLRKLASAYHVPYIIMHMRGTPRNMNQLTEYDNVVQEVVDVLQKKVSQFQQEGIFDIAVDPGFGFAKNADQNFTMLQKLEAFRMIGQPVLVGLSRKSMIWRTLNIKPEQALNGTTVLNTTALLKGADILRVHDVREAKECVELVRRLSGR